MSLIEHSTPAERARGCSLAEGFRSQAAVEADGWTVSGAPTFDPAEGVTLDGASDYLTLPLCGSEFNSAGLSIVVEFTPDFDWSENKDRAIFWGSDDKCVLYKRKAAQNYRIVLILGGTILGAILPADYASAWHVGKRHTLVISGTTANTSAWLKPEDGNSVKILDADASAWSAAVDTDLYVGVAGGGGGYHFDGTIHRLQVYKVQLEDQEALDICNGSTYRYLDDATLILTGAMEDHDPVNKRVLDRSGNGNHVTLGDGAGSDEPTKLPGAGYALTGGQYMEIPLAAWPGTTGTVAVMHRIDGSTGNGRVWSAHHSSGGNYDHRTYLNALASLGTILGVVSSTVQPFIAQPPQLGEENAGITTWSLSAGQTSWVGFGQGRKINSGAIGAQLPAPDVDFYLGKWTGGGWLEGRIYSAVVLSSALTTLQALDLTHRMRAWARRT